MSRNADDAVMPKAVRDLVNDYLIIPDRRPGGRPVLPPERVAEARAWLERILIDRDAFDAHVHLLQTGYGVTFRPPRPHWERPEGDRPALPETASAFRHHELLDEARAVQVAQGGPGVLHDDELARLLLNPYALWDLADLIDATLPDYWLDRMDAHGRELIAHHGLEVTVPVMDDSTSEPEEQPELALAGLLHAHAVVDAQGGDCWRLDFADDAGKALARRIAWQLYGDPGRAFTLRLYRVPVAGNREQAQAEVEVSPAPTKNDLELAITFPTGQRQAFTLEVPPEVKADPDAEPRERTRSTPGEPLPAVAFAFQGTPKWDDDDWPPHLDLSSGHQE
jgi:hypothetical protein